MLAATAAACSASAPICCCSASSAESSLASASMTHGANLLLITSGRRGAPALIGTGPSSKFSDPLPEALVLTAIVITFGVTTLLLALAYRSWLLTSDDEVQDDVGDRAIARSDVVHDEVSDQQKVIAREDTP